MHCSQCGTESQSTPYCRVCGANLQEIAPSSPPSKRHERHGPLISFGRKKTPAERREAHITKGIVSFCSGIGLTVFLYYLSAALVLKLPPEVIERIPFEIGPVVRIIWLFGLLPTTAGIGHILAGLLIRPEQEKTRQLDQVVSTPRELSITDHTTNLLS